MTGCERRRRSPRIAADCSKESRRAGPSRLDPMATLRTECGISTSWPPGRSSASNTTVSSWMSKHSSAQLTPAMPAPTMTTSCCSSPRTRVGAHRDQRIAREALDALDPLSRSHPGHSDAHGYPQGALDGFSSSAWERDAIASRPRECGEGRPMSDNANVESASNSSDREVEAAPPPPAPEEPVLRIGEIVVSAHWVATPSGNAALADSHWTVADRVAGTA